ncbi:uncharacterized protein LOC109854062 [Pseudomyrmex gracilis]|uniref:uncharacterized protein LOC109854062 n=1 Tax=Pseudomyrmex gracilis TaxID=219809 RepID=UPI000994F207|nr:uncharacterized protein LOC109854062 [Pseudomyrmex gracilis]
MVIVLFHLLCLLGKYMYNSYRVKKLRALCEETARHDESETIYEMFEEIYDDRPLSTTKCELRFSPPAYIQRYNAVVDVLQHTYEGQVRKVVDFGCAELTFVKFLKAINEIEEILCVDIDRELLEYHKHKAMPLNAEYLHPRKRPLTIEICEGSVTHPDQKLKNTDAVICIELIEHLYPDTLEDLPFNIFGYIKPKVVIITTPNADFNVLFSNFSGFRHADHKFEWTRNQFKDWAENIVTRYPCYNVTFHGICYGPAGTEELGACTQMAVFHRLHSIEEPIEELGADGLLSTVATYEYPVERDSRSDEQKIHDTAIYYTNFLMYDIPRFADESFGEVSLEKVLGFVLRKFTISIDTLRTILEEEGWVIEDREDGPVVLHVENSSGSEFDIDEADFDFAHDNDSDYGCAESDSNTYEIPIPETRAHAIAESWQNLYTDNWNEESSVIITENRSINQEHTYLFDGENLDEMFEEANATCNHLELKDTTNKSSADDNRLELSQDDEMKFRTAQELIGLSLNFHPSLSVSRSSTSPDQPLGLNSEWDNCPQNYYSENEFYNNSSLLNSTFCQSEIPNDAPVKDVEFTGIQNIEECPSEEDYTQENSNAIVSFSGNSFISQPIFTSSPCTKESTSNSVEQRNVKKRKRLMSPMNSRTSSKTGETIEEAESDTDLLNNTSEISNSNTLIETIAQCTTLSNSEVSTSSKSDTRTQPNVCVENKEFASDNNLSCTELKQHVNDRFTKNKSAIKRETDIANDDVQTMESCPTTMLDNENVEHKEENACCTVATTDNDHVKAHMENIISSAISNCITQSNLSHKSPPRELSNFRSQNDDERSSSKCAKEINSLESNKCKSNEEAHNQFTSQNDGIAQVGTSKDASAISNTTGLVDNIEAKPSLSSPPETPPNSWSPEIMDSGYPNSASAQDITPEYDLSSIAQDHIPDSESPSIAEAPRLVVEPVEVENGDLANNNRDDEGNNMMAVDANDIENLQPLIDVLENDLENENDIYVMQNGFPIWLLRILDMANPVDFDIQARQNLRVPGEVADAVDYVGHDDEGFDSSSENESDVASNEMEHDNEHDK